MHYSNGIKDVHRGLATLSQLVNGYSCQNPTRLVTTYQIVRNNRHKNEVGRMRKCIWHLSGMKLRLSWTYQNSEPKSQTCLLFLSLFLKNFTKKSKSFKKNVSNEFKHIFKKILTNQSKWLVDSEKLSITAY